MPRCAKGHEAGLSLLCPSCGAAVSFRGGIQALLDVPVPEARFEEAAVLFVGSPPFSLPGVYAAGAALGGGDEGARVFPAGGIEGGTWLDYNSRYAEKFRRWARLTCFARSRYRVVVLDTTSPLAVLAVNNLPLPDSTLVMATIPGAKATPVAQNSSYAALQLARRRGMHVVLALDSFVGRLAAFTEGKGLSTGRKAYEEVLAYLVSFAPDVADLVQKDARLGVGAHFYSILLSASESVFRSVEGALEVQLTQTSLEGSPEKVITAHLLASAPAGMQPELEASFGRVAARDGWSLLNAEPRVRAKPAGRGLYDVLLLYGVKEPTVLDALRAGYQTVASTAPELSLEGGLVPVRESSPDPVVDEPGKAEPRPESKRLALMEEFVAARGEAVELALRMRSDPRDALLAYRAEVPDQGDPLQGLLAVYRDWLQGAYDEFAASLPEANGTDPGTAEKLCAVATCIAAVQDAVFAHDAGGEGRAQKLLEELGAPHRDLEGLSLAAATEALLKSAEPLFAG